MFQVAHSTSAVRTDSSHCGYQCFPSYGFQECSGKVDGCRATNQVRYGRLLPGKGKGVLICFERIAQEELRGKVFTTNCAHAVDSDNIKFCCFPGANVKNASLVAEVDDLNRKLREMIEQIREKDRQISKLQGNYTKVSSWNRMA